MALPTYPGDTNYIATLDDLPNDVGGLTAAQLKAKFDLFGTEFKTWLNGTFIPALTNEIPKIAGGYTGTPGTSGTINLTSYGFTSVTTAQLTCVSAGTATIINLNTTTLQYSISGGTATDLFWIVVGK